MATAEAGSVDAPVRIRPDIAALDPYRQGKQASVGAYKLSSNENPFEPLPGVVEAVRAADSFNRYPDATAASLRRELAAKYAVPVEKIHVAAGSVSIIAQLILATADPGDEVIFPWPSFEGYPSLCRVAGGVAVPVALTVDHEHDLELMAQAVSARTRMILLCSPNNPTGTVISKAAFERFHAAIPGNVLVVLDEAYAEFVRDPSAIEGPLYSLNDRYDNVVVLRTFSKAYGLAALRVGYAIGHPHILGAARATAIPLSVTAHAEAAALASLRAETQVRSRIDVLVERRDLIVGRLRDIGWHIPSPQGNFIWLPATENSEFIASSFEEAGLIVRPFPGAGVRITVGEEETSDLISATAAALFESHNW